MRHDIEDGGAAVPAAPPTEAAVVPGIFRDPAAVRTTLGKRKNDYADGARPETYEVDPRDMKKPTR